MQNNYFLSNIPCHLKINGIYVGEIDGNLKLIQAKENSIFLEFLPKNNLYYPVYGNKTSEYLRVFKVENGFLYYPVFLLKKSLPTKIIFQKSEGFSFGEVLLTVITGGDVKMFLDGYLSDVKPLPFIPNGYEIKFLDGFIAVLLKGVKTAVFLYDINTRKLCYLDVLDEVYFSDVLTAVKRYKTVTKTIIKETWSISSEVKLLSLESNLEKPYREINENLLSLAFFENASLGADLKEIVTSNFYEKTANLKSFLGDVINVVFSPVKKGEVWLIENDVVIKGSLQMKGNLIDNVILDDF